MVEAFQRAVETGDVNGLLGVLAPDVVGLSDGGGIKHAVPKPIVGADKVSRLYGVGMMRAGAAMSAEPIEVNGRPALLIRLDGALDGIMAFRIEGGRVTGIYYVRNPEKLSRLEQETAVSR